MKDIRIDEHVCIKCPDLIKMGDHIAIDWGFYCTTQLELKDWIHIGPYCTVIGGKDGLFKVGNFSALSAGCRIICCSDDFSGESIICPFVPQQYRKIISVPVIMEDYATLGTNVVVFPGITIAEGSVVGANSVVRESTKPWSVYVGNPARFVKARSKKLLEYVKEMGYNGG